MSKILPSLTLILGGAASGKSSFAEHLVTETDLSRVYIATAQAHDTEMAEKIARHRNDRGADWQTIEAPFDLITPLAAATVGQVILLDCATLWLTNQLLADADPAAGQSELCAALGRCAAPVVIVSNEVGAGIVPDNALSRRFRNDQGALNQALAAQADLVVAVMAGLPLVLKGTLPAASR